VSRAASAATRTRSSQRAASSGAAF
jgi:hypothetical protein